jgi:hypothetical protein
MLRNVLRRYFMSHGTYQQHMWQSVQDRMLIPHADEIEEYKRRMEQLHISRETTHLWNKIGTVLMRSKLPCSINVLLSVPQESQVEVVDMLDTQGYVAYCLDHVLTVRRDKID